MTYREQIQTMIEDRQRIYDRVGHLRDQASEQEKNQWNQVRRVLPDAWSPLQNLDNTLSDRRAEMEV